MENFPKTFYLNEPKKILISIQIITLKSSRLNCLKECFAKLNSIIMIFISITPSLNAREAALKKDSFILTRKIIIMTIIQAVSREFQSLREKIANYLHF